MNTILKRLALLALALASPGLAARPLACDGDAAAVRTELITFAQSFDVLAAGFGNLGIEGAEAMHANARALVDHVAGLPPESAAILCNQLKAQPATRELQESLAEVLALAQQHDLRAGSSCVTLPPNAWQSLFITVESLKTASTLVSGLCGATECISLICIAPCIFSGVAESAAVAGQAVLDRADYCETVESGAALQSFAQSSDRKLDAIDQALLVVKPRTDVPLSTRATESQVLGTLDRTQRGFAQINDQIEGLGDRTEAQRLRAVRAGSDAMGRRIEQALRPGLDAAVVSLMLPRARGGEIEMLREHVAEAIQTWASLGVDVTAANALFATGDQLLNAGRYRAAYLQYRQAYQSFVLPPPVKPLPGTKS